MNIPIKIKSTLVILLIAISTLATAQSKFKVTLDAGHGGKDIGANYNGRVEKKIALEVVLKVGKILEAQPNISVNYTRETDEFIELVERANVANRVDANIFVSIHCNANRNLDADGTETYVMGLSKSKSSLAVAQSENEVVTLEKDYKKNYKGYNPNSPESFIGTTVIQEEFMENSIALASRIQDNFISIGKKSRASGVKQAPFMVLHKAYMPRVLIEMGFISNDIEGDVLDSEKGQNDIALAIATAIVSYKKEYFGEGPDANDGKDEFRPIKDDIKPIKDAPKPKVEISNSQNKSSEIIKSDLTYKIQLSVSSKKMALTAKNFKGLGDISMIKDGKFYKYFYSNTSNSDQIKLQLNEARAKGYKSAYIVSFKNGIKLN